MLRVDWTRFGVAVRAHVISDAANYRGLEKSMGLSHARLHSAAHGRPVGTEIFLTLCDWMEADPLSFCHPTTRRAHSTHDGD
jgi:hypothetical protein